MRAALKATMAAAVVAGISGFATAASAEVYGLCWSNTGPAPSNRPVRSRVFSVPYPIETKDSVPQMMRAVQAFVGPNMRVGHTACEFFPTRSEAEAKEAKMVGWDQRSLSRHPEVSTPARYIDFVPSGAPAPQGVVRVVHDPLGRVGALAVDRKTAKDAEGWAYDQPDIATAERKALEDCEMTGQKCEVVLTFTGGCGAYAIELSNPAIRGWGTAVEMTAAQNTAWQEVKKRGGKEILVKVWACNSKPRSGKPTSGPTVAAPKPPAGPTKAQEAERLAVEREAAKVRVAAAEAERTASLNREVAERDAAIKRRNAEIKAADERRQREYLEALAAQKAEADRIRREAAAAKARYEAEMAAWRARVAACNAGDYTQCQ